MASGSKFISHIKTWVLVVPFVMVFIVPFFSAEWIYTITSEEVSANIAAFGDDRHAEVIENVDKQFARWFIHNGIYDKTLQSDRGGKQLAVGEMANSYLNTYFDHLWKMVYRAMYRMHIAWQWLLGGVILIFAFMYDGWQSRNIKKHTVSTGNPLAIHLVLHSTFFLIGSSVALLFFPVAITTVAWGVGILLMALFSWKLSESFQSTN